jgi:hypothetical protein
MRANTLTTLFAILAVSIVFAAHWPAATQPREKVPYATLDDVPRGVWFRRRDKPHLCDVQNWFQVDSVNPVDGSLMIAEQYVTPGEMLERWVWTDDPQAKTLVVNRCGK